MTDQFHSKLWLFGAGVSAGLYLATVANNDPHVWFLVSGIAQVFVSAFFEYRKGES